MTFHLQLDQTNKLNTSNLILKIKWLDLRARTILSYRFSSKMEPSLSRITTLPTLFVLVVLISPLLASDVDTSYQLIFLCSFLLVLKTFWSISANVCIVWWFYFGLHTFLFKVKNGLSPIFRILVFEVLLKFCLF